MQHIIMPPQAIIMGMPPFIMVIMRLQQSMNISGDMPSIGIISQVMPVGVMVQVILAIIIGMGIGIIPPIIPFIIGIGIMPPIMGIGIMPFIGMPPIIGIIPFIPIIGCMVMAAFIVVSEISVAQPAAASWSGV